MNPRFARNQSRTLTAAAFDKLLAALDTDRERAGERYETVRHKLIKFFEWRGCRQPEDYADEVMNRVARRLDEGEQVEDIKSYVGGVARLLLLEHFKESEKRQMALDYLERTAPRTDEPEEEDTLEQARLRCFESCMANFSAEHRELITKYYADERREKIDNRRALAENLGIPLNALRIRAHRIRHRLEACVTACLQGFSGA